MSSPQRIPLEVGHTALAIGEYSVGVPPTRTAEQLVAAYIELVTLVRRDNPEYLREDDFEALAEATNQPASFFRNRIVSNLRSQAVS